MIQRGNLRIRVASSLGLGLDATSGSALDEAGNILGGLGPGDGDGLDVDGEVEAVDPAGLVEDMIRVGYAAGAVATDIVEAVGKSRRALCLTHLGGSSGGSGTRSELGGMDTGEVLRLEYAEGISCS